MTASPYIDPPTIREGQTISDYRHLRPHRRKWHRIRHALAWLAYQTRRTS